jgi:hypothetical protein
MYSASRMVINVTLLLHIHSFVHPRLGEASHIKIKQWQMVARWWRELREHGG